MFVNAIHRARGCTVRVAPLLLGLLPLCANAYQQAGHYYSVHLSYLDLLEDAPNAGPHFDIRDVAVISFCAQLPDQSSDLDAVSVYWHAMSHSTYAWLKWAVADHTDSVAILKMVLVQQLLHGLTGGEAHAVRSAASATVSRLATNLSGTQVATKERNIQLCALGFAMHLYGDSFAHTEMLPPKTVDSNTPIMYPTGRGHAWDMHYPDYPLCAAFAGGPRAEHHCKVALDGRFGAWAEYLRSVYGMIYPHTPTSAKYLTSIDRVVQEVYAQRTGAWDGDDWNEGKIQTDLYAPGADASLESFFDKHRSSEPCSVVLAAALASGGGGGPLQGMQSFTCLEAWAEFAKIAKEEFAAAGPRARPLQIHPDPLNVTGTTTPFTPDD